MIKPVAYVAEDDPDQLAITVCHMESLGFVVRAGTTGWEAYRAMCDPAAPGGGYDVAVLDNGLGIGPKGVDTLIGMRAIGANTPVVIYTAGILFGFLSRVCKQNRAELLGKPSSAKELAAAIEAAGAVLPGVVA